MEYANFSNVDRDLTKSMLVVVLGFAIAILMLTPVASAAPRPAAQDSQAANPNAQTVQYDSAGFSISAYLVKPSGAGKHPAVIVIHDVQGLTEGVRDMTRQFAAAGFLAMAPDLASRAGGSKTPQQAQAAIGQMPVHTSVEDLQAGYAYLQKDPDVDPDKISAVGFGWGGWRSLALASEVPTLYRAVNYSGATPTSGLENIHAPVMANYAQYDFRDVGIAIYIQNQMKQMGKKFTYYVYPNADRAFFNPANQQQYDPESAKLAWTRTLEFLR